MCLQKATKNAYHPAVKTWMKCGSTAGSFHVSWSHYSVGVPAWSGCANPACALTGIARLSSFWIRKFPILSHMCLFQNQDIPLPRRDGAHSSCEGRCRASLDANTSLPRTLESIGDTSANSQRSTYQQILVQKGRHVLSSVFGCETMDKRLFMFRTILFMQRIGGNYKQWAKCTMILRPSNNQSHHVDLTNIIGKSK